MTDSPASPAVTSRRWLLFAFLTVGLWGVWGALGTRAGRETVEVP